MYFKPCSTNATLFALHCWAGANFSVSRSGSCSSMTGDKGTRDLQMYPWYVGASGPTDYWRKLPDGELILICPVSMSPQGPATIFTKGKK